MSEAWQPVWEQPLPPGAEEAPANPGPDRQGEDNSFWRNLGIGWLQNSGVALRAEEQIDRAAAFEGAFRPAPVEGYTPFSDPALLRGFEDDLAMFAGSRSPQETQFIADQILRRRARARELDGAGFASQFLGGNLTPEAIASLPIGIGALTALGRTGRAGQAALRVGALGATQAGAEAAFRDSTLPREAQGSIPLEAVFGGMFGMALGGAAGALSRGTLSQAARTFERDHRTYEGAPLQARASRNPGESDLVDGIDPDSYQGWGWLDRNELNPEGRAAAENLLRQLAGPEAQLRLTELPEGYNALATGHLVSLAYGLADPANAAAGRLTVRHEAIHLLRGMGGFTDAQWSMLEREAPTWMGVFDIRRRYADQPDIWAEEAIAERFAHWASGRERNRFSPAENGLWEQIKDMLLRVYNGLRGQGFETVDSLFRKIESGEAGRITRRPDEWTDDGARQFADEFIQGQRAQAQGVRASRGVPPDPALRGVDEVELEARIRDVGLRLDALEADAPEVRALEAERDALEGEARRRRPERGEPEAGWTPEEDPLAAEIEGAPALRAPGEGVATPLDIGPAPDPAEVAAGASAAPPAPPVVPPGSAGAPVVPDPALLEPDRIASGSGGRLIRWAQMPWYVLKNNSFTGPLANALARLGDELVMAPLTRTEGNRAGVASETASVEATARQQAWRFVVAEQNQMREYYRYRGWNPESAGDVRSRAVELKENMPLVGGQAQAAGKLTFAEFDQAVGLAITGDHGPPEAQAAARFWREQFYEPLEALGAERGAILTARHRAAGLAALARESAGIEARLVRVEERITALAGIEPAWVAEAAKNQPRLDAARTTLEERQTRVRRARAALAAAPDSRALKREIAMALTSMENAQKQVEALAGPSRQIAAARAKLQADEVGAAWMAEEFGLKGDLKVNESRAKVLAEQAPMKEPYVPRVWVEEKVRRGRDALVKKLGDHWNAQAGHTWASAGVRAEIAIGRVVNDGIADTLERVLVRHLRDTGMAEELAAAEAQRLGRRVREHVGKTEPGRLKVEIASMLGNKAERSTDEFGLSEFVDQALADAGVRGAGSPSPGAKPGAVGDLTRLVREIMGGEDAKPGDRWADFARPGHAKERTIDIPTVEIAEYLDLSQRTGAIDYARRIGTAIEMAGKMGDPSMLGRLSSNRIAMLDEIGAGNGTMDEFRRVDRASHELRDKLLGTYRIPEDPSAISVRTIRGLTNAAIMTQMGRGVFSVVTDLGRIAMSQGFRRVMAGIMEGNPVFGSQFEAYRLGGLEAARAGGASELALLDRAAAMYDRQGVGSEANGLERFLQGGASTMMFVNLMAPATQLGQRFAGALIQSDMVDLALRMGQGSVTKLDRERFAAYGFDEADAGRIAAEWRAAGSDKRGALFLMNSEGWADQAFRQRVRGALATAVDMAVIRPNIADKPNFMSAPLWRGMMLYRGFSIAATQRIMMSGLQQRDAYVMSGMLSSIALAWLFGGPAGGEHDKNPVLSGARLVGAVERSGVGGLLSDLNIAAETLSQNTLGVRPSIASLDPSNSAGKPPPHMRNVTWAQQASQVGGAALAPWLNVTWAMTSPDAKASQVGGYIRRVVPFNNLLWVNWLWDGLTKQATTTLGPEPVPRRSQPSASPAGV